MAEHVDRIREQFTRQADAYAETQQARDETAHRALVALSGVGANDRVLDVACGPGFLTLAFAGVCGQAIGLDATPALLERARAAAAERGVSNVEFREGDATILPFEEGVFDVAVCRAAFHHFPDPGAVLREMRRVVKAGGRVLVGDLVTSDDVEEAAVQHRVEVLCDPTHVRALTSAELSALFADAGLDCELELERTLDEDLEEWIGHGGPAREDEAAIRETFARCLERDDSGLRVRREEGRVVFTHRVSVVLARRPV